MWNCARWKVMPPRPSSTDAAGSTPAGGVPLPPKKASSSSAATLSSVPNTAVSLGPSASSSGPTSTGPALSAKTPTVHKTASLLSCEGHAAADEGGDPGEGVGDAQPSS